MGAGRKPKGWGAAMVFWAVGVLGWAQPASAPVFHLALGDASPPVYWSTAPDGVEGRGLVFDLMVEVCRTAGWRLDAAWFPLVRVQNLVTLGERDVMVNVVTPARLEYATPSRSPLFTSPVKIFVRKDSAYLVALRGARTLDELARIPVTVGALLGSGWTKTNLEARGMKIDYSSGTVSGVEKLIAKRVDIVVDVELTINWIRRSLPGGEDLVELPQIIEVVGWHALVSKRSPFAQNMAALDAAIDSVRSNAAYREILGRYRLPEAFTTRGDGSTR